MKGKKSEGCATIYVLVEQQQSFRANEHWQMMGHPSLHVSGEDACRWWAVSDAA